MARIYLCQEKYKDFLKILGQVNAYLQKLDGLKMLKCEMLGLYSAYFYKIGNYHEAKKN